MIAAIAFMLALVLLLMVIDRMRTVTAEAPYRPGQESAPSLPGAFNDKRLGRTLPAPFR